MTTPEAHGRRQAREAALQMLYQSEIGKAGALESIATFWPAREADAQLDEPLREFANGLVRGATSRLEEIDRLLVAHANNWRIERMGVIDRLVLRLAAYEMLAEPETPSKVIINEAIELARSFSGEEAVGFVNGVLDSIRKELRRS
ncbi:MAG: transcription antitermination factor NusB [Vicinamibacterales bacterium]